MKVNKPTRIQPVCAPGMLFQFNANGGPTQVI